ncbi:FAD-dependent oxidoreductase [Mycobacterium hubeiense]|uniref:FAD-dependent oxidoreductase n=1 Tax=Mycobacterium hubeiense TaxID=1867256 RepID=UPI000C7F5FB9|nr:NAD(P)/FAD-dependent oxidoreductase [Mycobacterium sp. QGD 101]
MFTPTPVEKQYEQAAPDDLRILVVGAGIAGITVAQLLRNDGRHPVLIERADDGSHPGYMLALMPMAEPALDDLGLRDRYRAASVQFEHYGMRSHTGRLMRVDPIGQILSRNGDYRGISRGALIDVLTGDGCTVSFGSTVTALTETPEAVRVCVSEAGVAHELEFDLVIVADGIHSDTRELVLGGAPVEVVDTEWGGWVAWAPADDKLDTGEELWGAGNFVGLYPVAGGIGVFLGGPRSDTAAGAPAFAERFRKALKVVDPRIDRALDAVATDPDPYYWALTDCRAPQWTTGRTVLLGDAAAGFLPTAGIGAGMAMESAWILAGVLRHADRRVLARLLGAYERAQRPRVQTAQDNSRQLANLMFHRSRTLAVLREVAMRFVSVETAIGPIRRLLREQLDPDAIAKSLVAGAVTE